MKGKFSKISKSLKILWACLLPSDIPFTILLIIKIIPKLQRSCSKISSDTLYSSPFQYKYQDANTNLNYTYHFPFFYLFFFFYLSLFIFAFPLFHPIFIYLNIILKVIWNDCSFYCKIDFIHFFHLFSLVTDRNRFLFWLIECLHVNRLFITSFWFHSNLVLEKAMLSNHKNIKIFL